MCVQVLNGLRRLPFHPPIHLAEDDFEDIFMPQLSKRHRFAALKESMQALHSSRQLSHEAIDPLAVEAPEVGTAAGAAVGEQEQEPEIDLETFEACMKVQMSHYIHRMCSVTIKTAEAGDPTALVLTSLKVLLMQQQLLTNKIEHHHHVVEATTPAAATQFREAVHRVEALQSAVSAFASSAKAGTRAPHADAAGGAAIEGGGEHTAGRQEQVMAGGSWGQLQRAVKDHGVAEVGGGGQCPSNDKNGGHGLKADAVLHEKMDSILNLMGTFATSLNEVRRQQTVLAEQQSSLQEQMRQLAAPHLLESRLSAQTRAHTHTPLSKVQGRAPRIGASEGRLLEGEADDGAEEVGTESVHCTPLVSREVGGAQAAAIASSLQVPPSTTASFHVPPDAHYGGEGRGVRAPRGPLQYPLVKSQALDSMEYRNEMLEPPRTRAGGTGIWRGTDTRLFPVADSAPTPKGLARSAARAPGWPPPGKDGNGIGYHGPPAGSGRPASAGLDFLASLLESKTEKPVRARDADLGEQAELSAATDAGGGGGGGGGGVLNCEVEAGNREPAAVGGGLSAKTLEDAASVESQIRSEVVFVHLEAGSG